MLIRKTKISKYTLRIPSPRVTPSSSLSDIEWNNETKYNRQVFYFPLYDRKKNGMFDICFFFKENLVYDGYLRKESITLSQQRVV
jgi:hypothetical protein